MRHNRVLLVLFVLLLGLAGSPAAGGAKSAHQKTGRPALHRGDHGQRVRDAEWNLKGHNVFRIGTYRGPVDGEYGRGAATATRRMKYRLGYPARTLNGRFGHVLYVLLRGDRALPPPYQTRKHRRWLALSREKQGSRLGVVALVGDCKDAPPDPYVLVYTQRIAAVYGRPLVCTSGRRHTLVLGTNRPSMHNYGAAADLATPTERMNVEVGQSALIAAGMSAARARSILSPIPYGYWYGGVNILFQTYAGGNHHNHVHVGLWCWPRPVTCRRSR